MRATFLIILCGCLWSGALAAEEPFTHWALENHAGISKSPATHHHEFICHKDHSGLDLVAAERLADAKARLDAAIDGGGMFTVVEIEGLSCAYCAAAIEKAFSARPEVAAAYVNTRNGTLSLVMLAGEALDDRMIRKLIKRRGYAAGKILRDASFDKPVTAAATTPLQ